jgi:hypothetical protein
MKLMLLGGALVGIGALRRESRAQFFTAISRQKLKEAGSIRPFSL